MTTRYAHPLPFGAELRPGGTTRFRVWAPSADGLTLELRDGGSRAMRAAGGGWHEAEVPAPAGARYRFRMGEMAFPDPASRAQDGDVHGWSVVVDPGSYAWQVADWTGRPWHEAVVYEVHAGLMGGFDGIRERLPELKALGITAVEIMPIADFPGTRNWGYDGVLPYAPDEAYGSPEALKRLVDEAHGLGLMVMLDVVYNHFGPDGAYIHAFAKPFFREDVKTPWGAAIDFRRDEVRDYFLQNALYWLREYRFDGLRFDAVHAIGDPEFLDAMARTIRDRVEPGRHVHLVLEHEGNRASHLRDGPDSRLYDAQWADDWHHCVHVLLTGEREGYYEDYQNAARLLARCMAEGFAYQGEVSPHLGTPRGEPSAQLPPTGFVICLQNHDQIGNRAMGERLARLANPSGLRAAAALLLLSPSIPLIFMGEEWATQRPFLFFTAHNEELAELVRNGRREEFKHFSAFQDEAKRAQIPDPNAEATYDASRPDQEDPEMRALYARLLDLRATRVVPGIPGARSEGARAVGEAAVVGSWRLGTGERLTIACNLGPEQAVVTGLQGHTLFEPDIGAASAVRNGHIPPRTAVALIEDAPGAEGDRS